MKTGDRGIQKITGAFGTPLYFVPGLFQLVYSTIVSDEGLGSFANVVLDSVPCVCLRPRGLPGTR